MNAGAPQSLSGVRTVVFDGHASEAVAAVQSLGRLGADITVVANSPGAVALRSRYAKRWVILEAHDPRFDRLLTSCIDGASDVVILSTEASLVRGAARATSSSARQRCTLPPQFSLELMLDKPRTTRHAESVGIAVPRSTVIDSVDAIASVPQYPVVLKPTRSKVWIDGRVRHLSVCIAQDDRQRRTFLDGMLPIVPVQQQEFVGGRDIAVAVVYERSILRWVFAYERIRTFPREGGVGTYRRTANVDSSLLSAVKRLFDPLEWHGPAMIEFRVPLAEPPLLIEVNPRLWGSVPLAVAAGADFPAAIAALALGRPPPPQPHYRVPLYGRNIVGELRRCRTDNRGEASIVRPVTSAMRELGSVLLGKERWDHFSLTDPRVAVAVIRDALRG